MKGNASAASELSVGREALSVEEFCHAHNISRAMFYLLQTRGSGPRVMKVGRRTLITKDASRAWRDRMEQQAAA
jgi:hypothetical protein